MERELGWSYWTIRNRLNEIIAELGFEANSATEESNALQRHEVLAQLESGHLGVNEAAEMLARLRAS